MRLINIDVFVEWLLSDAITDEQRQFAEKVRYAAERMQSATDTNVGGNLIDRQAALDAIDEIASEVEDGYGFQYAKWREFFCNLPSAQPDLDEWCTDCTEYDQERHCCPRWNRVIRQTVDDVEQNRWTPCSTRKPEKSGLYLVTKQQKTGEIQLATAHYNTAFDEWSGNGNFKKVLAWQPLPSPWKEEQ